MLEEGVGGADQSIYQRKVLNFWAFQLSSQRTEIIAGDERNEENYWPREKDT